MKPSVRPLLSVVVPLYNEAGNVAPLLERIAAVIERLRADVDYEIVLVNDGSTDGDAGRDPRGDDAARRTSYSSISRATSATSLPRRPASRSPPATPSC